MSRRRRGRRLDEVPEETKLVPYKVVQGSDGDDADGNGIASEWTVFQRKLIAAIDRFGSTLWASTVFHNDLLVILALLSVCCGSMFRPGRVLLGKVEIKLI